LAMERELLRHLGKKPATIIYPFEKYEPMEGTRAKIEIDIEKCIGCGTCIHDCPAYALEMVGKGLTCDMKWYPGRCIFCGQCVESCPRNAIKQTAEHDLATTESVEASGLMSERYVEFKRPKKEEE
jgi:formate hydrogenlyase subunit 6/NADH:ubiquinone oxidoreductase subunit I